MNASQPEKHLEPSQIRAAHTLDRHISVTAGPGAGKTMVLVERYLHILREKKPSSIDQIVAITFTNRAANEMRERLRRALDGLLTRSIGAERHRWMRYKRTLDGAVITTIHGFAMRLLREFPVEAGLDPQFMLLDEHRAGTLLEAAVEESLTEAIGRRDESVSRLTAGIGRPMLAKALFDLYLRTRGQGLAFDEILRRTADSHFATTDYDALCDELDRQMTALTSLRGLTSGASEKLAKAKRLWPHVREILRSREVSLADYCGAIVEFREAARPKALGHISTLVKDLDGILWGETKEKCFGRLPQTRFDVLAGDYASTLVKLLKTIDQRFADKKHELSALDFDDLQLRALELLKRPEVLGRTSLRYKFFLVDEFQDTNGMQRDLLEALALNSGARANLFIVGDRKQSIYGFRGADVDVFSSMTELLQASGGELIPLPLNFRSQPPLIKFFNYLFARFFRPGDDVSSSDLPELGYVDHELSEGRRDARDAPPLVELLIDRLSGDDDPKAKQALRERDARQVVQRIISLTSTADAPTGNVGISPAPTLGAFPKAATFEYRDIALLFRAMTDVPTYETAFRRAGIPFQTVLGKGFYEREEISDLIQLCRFLDNRTDEIALAAVLRSPLCGISDNTLLALRIGPRISETGPGEQPQARNHPRPLFQALRRQSEIDFISDDERAALEGASNFLASLIERRNRYSIADLLRFAIEKSNYTTVIAASFDGAQRLANVEKLFNLAERFARSGAHLIRDFVKYVHDFEALGSRESEGQLDDSANAVKLMTIHQAKGLEFPVVIIPDLHRQKPTWEGYFLLDRHRGLTLKIPNGRGQMVAGQTFTAFNERGQWRERFENMRLLYVAATRAQDRIIFSGATNSLGRLAKGDDNWLQLVWQALDLGARSQSGLVELSAYAQIQLTLNLVDQESETTEPTVGASLRGLPADAGPGAPTQGRRYGLSQNFSLLHALAPEHNEAVYRFSVTQLINYQRCPRQYFFDRVLHLPTSDELAVWNDAEAPEPPANLTATLKGAVIHRFCESYLGGANAEECLEQSLEQVIRARQSQFADRLLDIKPNEALKELWPLAQNYLSSPIFERVEEARKNSMGMSRVPADRAGLWSEQSFRLRRPSGILTGTIDKLLITPSSESPGLNIEVVDFKTNRFVQKSSSSSLSQQVAGANVAGAEPQFASSLSRSYPQTTTAQMGFDFSSPAVEAASTTEALSIDDQVRIAASDYQLQMQAYALAVRALMPTIATSQIRATLHFLQPNVEFPLSEDQISQEACAAALDNAMLTIISSTEPHQFPVRPATHCRMCNFLDVCPAGRQWQFNTRKPSAETARWDL